MSDLIVARWTSYEAASQLPESPIGGMGGCVEGTGWPEYLMGWMEEAMPHLEALRTAIVSQSIRCGGDRHQEDMCPVFSDGTAATFSMRAWGDLMASIWNTEDGGHRGYMGFYMDMTRGGDDATADRTDAMLAAEVEA